MKKIFLLISFLVLGNAFSSTYHRFWIGYKKKSIETKKFVEGLNSIFFGETINLSKGKGLVAYQPYITGMNGDHSDEIALVTYESEAKYREIRSTERGQAYGPLHWDYFDRETSKSTVPEEFKGQKLQEGRAYELNPSYTSWNTHTTYVGIYKYKGSEDLIKIREALTLNSTQENIKNLIVLIKGNYVYEYRSITDDTVRFIKLPLEIVEVKMLIQTELNRVPPIGFQEGVNFSGF